MKRVLVFVLGAVCALGFCSARAAETDAVDVSKLPPAADKNDVTYAVHIKPIFEKACIMCHKEGKARGKQRLDTIEATLQGGENGKTILPGKSAESPFIHCVAYIGKKIEYMPPPSKKATIPPLTKEEIGLLRAWIDQGAK